MQKKNICFGLLFISSLFISFSVSDPMFSISGTAYTQSAANSISRSTNFIDYYNPSIMMKIKYPSFWQKPDVINNDTISFSSPARSIGVIFQSKLVENMSNDEIIMKKINEIENSYSNVKILNMTVSSLKDGSMIQKLQFTYGNTPDMFKELQMTKVVDGRAYTFIYYADNALFDQFYPIVTVMYNSLQTPIFANTFSQPQILTSKPNSQNKQTIKNSLSISLKSNQLQTNNQNNSTLNLNNVSTYDNKSLGIKIDYPNFLKKAEKDRGISLSNANNSIGVLLVNVPIRNMSENDFISNHILSLNTSLTKFNIVNSSTSDLLGYPTQMILFTYNSGNFLYKGMQIWKVAGDHAYIFTYFAQSEKLFDEFLPTVTDMVESLRIS